jgi:predicted nucleic acid-binding protein
MYLLDTNILLEFLFNQKQADQDENFLRQTPRRQLYLSDFALYSMGVRLIRDDRPAVFGNLVTDLIINGGIQVVRLEDTDLLTVIDIAQTYKLDFDDAYQYVLAEKHNLTIVSFDAHFDKTPRGRKTPAQITKGT